MRPWLRAFLAGAIVTGACLSLPPAAAEDAAALVAKGRELVAKGDWPGAKDAFLAAVKADPKSVDARRGAADALLGLGLADEAIEQAYAGLDLVENRDAGLWLLAARAYLKKGETLPADRVQEIGNALADAKAKAGQALERDPGLSLARAVLAQAARMAGAPEDGLPVLEEGLARSPSDFDMLFEKGMCCLVLKRHEDALAAFTAAAEADGSSAEAQFQRGIALAWLKRRAECYDAFVEAAVLAPADNKPLKYLSNWAKDDSVKHFRAILARKPDHAWAHAYVAFYAAWGKAKDEASAVTEMKAAIALAPKDADLVAWNGVVLEGLGRKKDAQAAWLKAFGMNPAAQVAYDKLSERACAPPPNSDASVDEREALIKVLTDGRPEDAVLWNNAGLMYRDLAKDFRKSLAAYLKAAALAPNDQGIQNDTGLIYLYHGPSIKEDPRKGLPYFERCLALYDEEGQSPQMGVRDTLENLAVYYSSVEKDPRKCLEYARRRNDPGFLDALPKDVRGTSPKAAAAAQWAEAELKKR
jgi:tetratricopeptide (TPR) repeat protein